MKTEWATETLKEEALTIWNNTLKREWALLFSFDPPPSKRKKREFPYASQIQPPFLAVGIGTWKSLSSLKRENLSAIFVGFAFILGDCDEERPYVLDVRTPRAIVAHRFIQRLSFRVCFAFFGGRGIQCFLKTVIGQQRPHLLPIKRQQKQICLFVLMNEKKNKTQA